MGETLSHNLSHKQKETFTPSSVAQPLPGFITPPGKMMRIYDLTGSDNSETGDEGDFIRPPPRPRPQSFVAAFSTPAIPAPSTPSNPVASIPAIVYI